MDQETRTPEPQESAVKPTVKPNQGRFASVKRFFIRMNPMANALSNGGRYTPEQPIEQPAPKKEIKSYTDLPLRNVAIMVAAMGNKFTIEEIAGRLADGYNMDEKLALEVLRSRLYELGSAKAIRGELTRDPKTGDVTSTWTRLEDGDEVLEQIISPYGNKTNSSS